MATEGGAPFGWAEWEAWQDSDECAAALRLVGEDLRRMGVETDPDNPKGYWLGLSLNNLAACAFAAGLDAGRKGADDGD